LIFGPEGDIPAGDEFNTMGKPGSTVIMGSTAREGVEGLDNNTTVNINTTTSFLYIFTSLINHHYTNTLGKKGVRWARPG
jgi:hypothetical protein